MVKVECSIKVNIILPLHGTRFLSSAFLTIVVFDLSLEFFKNGVSGLGRMRVRADFPQFADGNLSINLCGQLSVIKAQAAFVWYKDMQKLCFAMQPQMLTVYFFFEWAASR